MEGSQKLPIRGHVRNNSSAVKAATRPRSSTKGPLDSDDIPVLKSPAAALQPQTAAAISAAVASSPTQSNMPSLSPTRSRHRSPGRRSPTRRPGFPMSPGLRPGSGGSASTISSNRRKDFSYLLRPEIYHPLPLTNIPPPFRQSSKQPAPDTPLHELLAKGHFRAAAIVAAQELTGTGSGTDVDNYDTSSDEETDSKDASATHKKKPIDPADHERIFSLFYTRLACLVLIDATPLAAQEVKALEDLNSGFYFDADRNHLVPWELRVLNVRLQALGFGDGRRAVMSFYELAREARARIVQATRSHDNTARELWKGRLAELGLKVAGALIEIDDMAGAAELLSSLTSSTSSAHQNRIEVAKALLWLQVGDVDAARLCVTAMDSHHDGKNLEPRVVTALCDMADDQYEEALTIWTELREDAPDDEMIGVNLAVCLLYVGKMVEGRSILESLVDTGYSSHTLLFNLSTMYELCSDHAKNMKQRLAVRMANKEPSVQGWEKTNADFKL